MICGVRRSTLAGREAQRRLPTLDQTIKELRDEKKRFRLDGRDVGRRVVTTVVRVAGITTLGFRHPTKKATAGRYAFLTVFG